MSLSQYQWRLWGWLTAAFSLGIIAGFMVRESVLGDKRLHYQSLVLTRIVRDSMLHRATPARVVGRVETDLNVSVEYGREKADLPGVIVLPAQTGLLGVGGRWIVHLRTADDGRCEQVWMELQPRGW